MPSVGLSGELGCEPQVISDCCARQPESVYYARIRTDNKPLITTGGHTWEAAHELFAFLAQVDILGIFAHDENGSQQRGLRLLELGSGSGWLGLNLAEIFRAHALSVSSREKERRDTDTLHITLTEQPGEALEWLIHNVDRFGPAPGHGSTVCVRAQSLDWAMQDFGEGYDVSSYEQTDLILGSDLIYNEIGATCLPRIVKQLLTLMMPRFSAVNRCLVRSISPYFLYAHTFHRYDLLDERFLQECEQIGLVVQEVADAVTWQLVPVNEVFCEEIFPEKRIAILHISLETANCNKECCVE